VNGPAYAGGCEIVLSCDLIVASTEARFGIPEVKRSLVAAAGGLFRLPRAIPKNIAMELALTGDPISAERAYEVGLVNRLSPPDQLLETATALAEQITANAPLAVRASRQIVLDGMLAADEDAWRITNEAFGAVASSEDFGEGPRAFIEKRAPQWKGR
jgi:enoyl-CoA hydratase